MATQAVVNPPCAKPAAPPMPALNAVPIPHPSVGAASTPASTPPPIWRALPSAATYAAAIGTATAIEPKTGKKIVSHNGNLVNA